MDANRLNAYLNLIQKLLRCPDGKEQTILDGHQDLLDAGLGEMMRQYAASLEKEDKSSADKLVNLAQQIEILSEHSDNDEYDRLNFLVEVLQLITESRGNAAAVYPLLVANLDKLDRTLLKLLQIWASQTLSQMNHEQAHNLAVAISGFGKLIWEFPLGNKAHNLELAITACQIALDFFTIETDPYNWATTQLNLAAVHTIRIEGQRSENIEHAITGCKEALKVFNFSDFPKQWLGIQNNLAVAYQDRIKGKPEENCEQSINICRKALSVCNPDIFPREWAILQSALGNVYLNSSKGNLVDNIEQAIAAYTLALRVFTRSNSPKEWAERQYALGKAYLLRQKESRSENLEQAIIAYSHALSIMTPESSPGLWSEAQNQLATAYYERIQGGRADNLEKALAAHNAALTLINTSTEPLRWAETQLKLGNVYCVRILGDREDNLEKAISAYSHALSMFNPDDSLQNWALIKSNLGIVYFERLREERKENIEKSIDILTDVVRVISPSDFPTLWGMASVNLAAAYFVRIKENRAENIEQMIILLNKALEVFTIDNNPDDWARVQMNLGLAYRERIYENWSDNIEKAIEACNAALNIFTYEDFPREWAMIQSNLGGAYSKRIQGDLADNIEQAITAYEASLKVFTKEDYPRDWALSQNDLGIVYYNRIRGQRTQNLERSIEACQDALKVRTLENLPEDYAQTQSNLGNTYIARIQGERSDNLEVAIDCYENAIKVYSYQAFPQKWARTKMNIGIAYNNRILGDKTENLENAVIAYQEALKVYTHKNYPQNWAEVHINLGSTYDKQGQIDDAIKSFRFALAVYTSDSRYFPHRAFLCARSLGDIFFESKKWSEAIDSYKISIQAVEQSRNWATNEQRKQEILSEAFSVYSNIIEAYIEHGQLDSAIEYAERSKNRNLVELITQRDVYPNGNIHQPIIQELDRLRREITIEHKQLANQEINRNTEMISGKGPEALQPQLLDYNHLNQLQQKLDELIAREITPIDPTFSITQKVKTISYSDIQSLVDKNTAILEWYITNEKILTFIVTPRTENGGLKVKTIENSKALGNWIIEYLSDYDTDSKTKTWRTRLSQKLEELAHILHIDEIVEEISPNCRQLILIPHLFLHLLPLHLLPTQNHKYLLDLFPSGVKYSPSCQLLQITHQQQRPNFQNLFAIQNPTEDLIYTDLEVETIRTLFSNSKVLAKEAAKEASVKIHQDLPLANCVHFSCHGKFNPNSPLESALLLAQNEEDSEDGRLTLGEIFELNLSQCRLVALSACETGLIDFSFSDEYIGLPNGFLYAGSPTVISSLWTVNDFSTAFLMIKFYQNLVRDNSVAIALNEAQKWLRDVTKLELQSWIEENKLPLTPVIRISLRRRLHELTDDDRPFEEPFYWAAFCAIGQ